MKLAARGHNSPVFFFLSDAFFPIYGVICFHQRFVNPNSRLLANTVGRERVSCIFTKAFIYPSECFIIIAEIDGRLDSTSTCRLSTYFDTA